MPGDSEFRLPGGHRDFRTTRWTTINRAGRQDGSAESERALEKLCRTYWYPLYVFLRRQGKSPQDAEDLTQSFFGHMLENNALRTARPERGRFRTFLLSSLKHFVTRSEEHTSELQSHSDLVCRLLLEKKKNKH